MWKAVNESLSNLCASAFWDTDLTWNSPHPHTTPCFRKTVLAWLPCVFLWLLLPLEIHLLRNSKSCRLPFTVHNVLKLFFILILVISSLVDIVDFIHSHHSHALVDFYTPVIKLFTFIVFFTLTYVNIKRGVKSSGILFFFSLLLVLCGIPQFCIDINQFRDGVLNSLDEFSYIIADADRTYALLESTSPFVYYLSVLIIFLQSCFADATPVVRNDDSKKKLCPEYSASFLSRTLLGWFDYFVWKGYRKPITACDLWELGDEMKSSHIAERFESKLLSRNKPSVNDVLVLHQMSKSQKGVNRKPRTKSVLRPLWDTFGSIASLGVLCKICYSILLFVNTVILGLLINFTANKNEFAWHGYFYALLLWIICTADDILYVQHWRIMNRGGLQIRSALISVIYKKALRISSRARTDFSLGEIVNLMAVDSQRFLDFMEQAASLVSIPLETVLAVYFLCKILGPSAFIGIGILIVLTPVNAWIASRVKILQMKQMHLKDNRIKLISEILSGIKVLKMYAWEPSFEEEIARIREKEIQTLKYAAYYSAPTTLIWTCAPFLLSLLTFAVFVLSSDENVLSPEVAFVSLALFDILKTPLSDIPPLIKFTVQAYVSLKRIDKFLNAEELDPNAVSHDQRSEAIIVEKGMFSWDSFEGLPILTDINLKIKPGALVAVVGPVGSGKSSLIAAMLGEMYKQCGYVNTNGSLAYVPQEAWIRNATLKDNIIFGNAEDSWLYRAVLEACALLPDLSILPAGDQTEIGEKGVNLSGGQKQRISLARAVYSAADIYFLDDPLSAVDSHVGRQIFEQIIGPNGLLKNKTRVFVTHSIAYLPQVDHIVVLQDGVISESGNYDELSKKKGNFAKFLLTYLKDEGTAIDEDEEVPQPRNISLRRKRSSKPSTIHSPEKSSEIIGQKLIDEEGTEMGKVKMTVYLYFLKALSPLLVFLAITTNAAFQALSALCGFWLSLWTGDTEVLETKLENLTRQYHYIDIFAIFVFFQVITMLVRTVALDVGVLRATKRIHNNLLNATLHWPAVMFDRIPIGRIINRFGFDIDLLDNMMPENLKKTLMRLTLIISIFLVISFTTPIFVCIIIPLIIIYFFLQRFYAASLRELKRLESVSRSPIYSHFSESVTGAQSIRAYNLQSKFIEISEEKVDNNQKSLFVFYMSRRWLDMRLEMMGAFITFSSAFCAVRERDTLTAGLVGLSVSFALQLTNTLGQLVQTISETEMNIVAVERIREYSSAEKEAPWELPDENVSPSWPDRGVIQFRDFQVRYREGLDLVLRGVSFNIKSCEKIGVVGRTGAGKSSLTLSLFRIIEPAGGQIIIDEIDISKIGLHTLRSRLTIIPQDPILFTGTLRMNLDPTKEHSDENVWKALELANLKPYISCLSNGLHYEVTEGGRNFSVGQRQLICLTRALLRRTKVLILDEATAAIDLETDELIQRTIRREFRDCTVLAIAHRLNTIMDYDKILVLDKGHVVEYDSPNTLLKRKESIFYKMANTAGLI